MYSRYEQLMPSVGYSHHRNGYRFCFETTKRYRFCFEKTNKRFCYETKKGTETETEHLSVGSSVGFSAKLAKWSRFRSSRCIYMCIQYVHVYNIYMCSYRGCEPTRKMARSVLRFLAESVKCWSVSVVFSFFRIYHT